MSNASDPLDYINYLQNHLTFFPRLGLVQKTLQFPELVSAKFHLDDNVQSGRWALIVLTNTLKTLGYEKEVQ
jgi:hypothetical protein